MSSPSPSRTQTERADLTRTRILDAAVQEFSENGLAGARTERIAEAAGVNKALLYYYFSSKGALYEAALGYVTQQVAASSMASLAGGGSAGESVLLFALDHFDRIHSKRAFQKLMQQEMVRLQRGEKNALATIIERVFHPMMVKLSDLLDEGKRSGELIATDEWQIMYSALGANVFYFLSSPVIGIMLRRNLLERAAMEFRRKATIEFLGQAIFTDRGHGAEVAARVLANTPMPASCAFEKFEGKAK